MIPTSITPVVREMTQHEQVEYGLCSRGLMLEQGERAYRLSSGSTDTIHVYEAGSAIVYVLTVNLRLDYVGFDWYMIGNDEPVDSVFLQGDYAIAECAGRDWRDITRLELARKLLQLFV